MIWSGSWATFWRSAHQYQHVSSIDEGLEFSLRGLEVYGLGKRLHHKILYYPDLDRSPSHKEGLGKSCLGLT